MDGQPMLPPIREWEEDPVELPAEPLAQPPSCPNAAQHSHPIAHMLDLLIRL